MRRSAFVAALLVLLAACSPVPLAGEDSATTSSTVVIPEGVPPASDPTTTTQPGPTTTVGLYAPKDIAFTYTCEQVDRPDAYALSCDTVGQTGLPQEFAASYWATFITFDLDENEEPISMTFGTGAYNGNCMWSPEAGSQTTAPLDNGIATFEAVLVATGHCEAVRFVMSGTWDLNEMTLAIDGHTEYKD